MSIIGIISTVQDVKFFTQGYFRTILSTAGKQIAGYSCALRLVSLTQEEFRHPDAARALLAAQRCDAALVVAPHAVFMPTIQAAFERMPGIVISPPRLDIPVSYVASDNRSSGAEIVVHLAARGRRRIVVLQPDTPSGDFEEREKGYRDGAATAGLNLTVLPIGYPLTDATFEPALALAPDAIVAPSDDDALPLMGALRRHRLRVPEDVAVAGFDDEDFAAEMSPPLTTVAQPVSAMAASATAYLVERLAGARADVYQEMFKNTLVVRKST
jgi:DNA-binding LacI/PurR family transcriptional regulator